MCGVEGGETPRKIDEDNQGKKMQINNLDLWLHISVAAPSGGGLGTPIFW